MGRESGAKRMRTLLRERLHLRLSLQFQWWWWMGRRHRERLRGAGWRWLQLPLQLGLRGQTVSSCIPRVVCTHGLLSLRPHKPKRRLRWRRRPSRPRQHGRATAASWHTIGCSDRWARLHPREAQAWTAWTLGPSVRQAQTCKACTCTLPVVHSFRPCSLLMRSYRCHVVSYVAERAVYRHEMRA